MRTTQDGGGGGGLGITVPSGDPGALEHAAGALRGIAGVVDSTATTLAGGPPVGWTGSAAMSFTDICGTESVAASRGAGAMTLASTILHALGEDLRAAQRAVRAQVEAAREAKQRADRAREEAEAASQRAAAQRFSAAASAKRASASEAAGLPASSERAAQRDALTRATEADEQRARHDRAAHSADDDLSEAQRRGRQLADRYEETARQSAKMLAGLCSMAPTVSAVNGQPVAATGGPGQPPALVPVTVTASPAPKPQDEEDDGGLLGDIVHGALDVGGLVPVLGAPADGLNALIYEAEGDHVNAGLSAAGMIPIAGEIATGGKLIGKGAKALDSATDAEKALDGAGDAARGADGAAGRIDYSRGFDTDIADAFEPGSLTAFSGRLDEPLELVQYYDKSGGGSYKWWTTTDAANSMDTTKKVHDGLALDPAWGARDAVAKIRVPEGTDVTYLRGLAKPQGEYPGGLEQFRFKDFDETWIVEKREIP